MSTLHPAFGSPGVANSLSTQNINATTDWLSFRYQAHSTTPIKKIKVWCTNLTASPGTLGVVLTSNVSGVPNVSGGVPVDIGGGSATLVTVAAASVFSTGAETTLTFTNAYTPTVGELIWVVLYPTTGTWDGSNHITLGSGSSFGLGVFIGDEIVATSVDTGTSFSYVTGGPAVSWLDASDNYLPTVISCVPGASSATATFADSATPDTYGNMFTTPANYSPVLWGVAFGVLNGPSSATNSDYSALLTKNPLSGSSEIGQIDIDVSVWRGAYSGSTLGFLRFPNGPYTLDANTAYAVSIKAAGAGSMNVFRFPFGDDAARLSMFLSRGLSQVTRTGGAGYGGSGDMTQSLLFACNIFPCFSLPDGSAGGGGGPRTHLGPLGVEGVRLF